MNANTIDRILALNLAFYQNFGRAFSATRRRVQPGVRRILESLPKEGSFLDLGCGNGELCAEMVRRGFSGSYTGLDFSATLLDEAQMRTSEDGQKLKVHFIPSNLANPFAWSAALAGQHFDFIFAFAVMHHIPSHHLRVRLARTVHNFLAPTGRFIHSEWQFHRSPRLLARIQPWSHTGLASEDVENGDYLLDWRFSLAGEDEDSSLPVGPRNLRYVHLFNPDELASLAVECGFRIIDEFDSDGHGGSLSLYQVWQAG